MGCPQLQFSGIDWAGIDGLQKVSNVPEDGRGLWNNWKG